MIRLYLEVDGASYAYIDEGKGKETIVFLHGFTGRKETWKTFIESLRESYRVIAIDLPGHGETKTKIPRTMEMVVDDLRYIFEKLNLQAIHLMGYSMGGRVALAYALTYPKTILTLTLESASPGLHQEQERAKRRARDLKLIRHLEKEGLQSFINFWENIPLFKTQQKLSKRSKEQVRQERLSQSVKGLMESLRYMGTGQQPSFWNNLQFLNCPVLLIVGQLDEKFVRLNEQMKQHLLEATLTIIEQVGHTVHLEAPKLFLQTIKSFIVKHKTI